MEKGKGGHSLKQMESLRFRCVITDAVGIPFVIPDGLAGRR